MRSWLQVFVVAGVVVCASMELTTNEYLPPFKPDDSPGLAYPETSVVQQTSYAAFGPTKDIYIPPVRLPLANEVYEPISRVPYAGRPINQSPVVNSANFPPYFQTTSMDLVYPKDPSHSSNVGGNNYYTVQTQGLYKPLKPSSNPVQNLLVPRPDKGSNFKPPFFAGGSNFQSHRPFGGPVVPDFATPPTATTFPPPTFKPAFATPPVATTFPPPNFKPFLIRDPTFGGSASARSKGK